MNKNSTQIFLYANFLGLILCFFCKPAFSLELTENIQIHGFLTQGAFYTSDNNYSGKSDDKVSFDQTEVGFNIFWQMNEKIDFSAQSLYRRAGAVENSDLRLDYGMMNINLLSNENNYFGVRLGRIKNPYGLYNETRDVAFTTPSILLAQSIYLERSRSLFVASDGVQLYSRHQLVGGWLSLKANYGKVHNDNNEIQRILFGSIAQGKLDSDDAFFIGQIRYNFQSDRYVFALSYADITLEYEPGEQDPVGAGSARFRPYILSAQYNGEYISLTSEYYYSKNELRGFGSVLPDTSPVTINWYVQGNYRWSHQWQTILRYDVNYLNNDDRKGSVFERNGLPAHIGFTKDWMIGLRWDISPSLMLRGEYHYINGTSWTSNADNPNRNKTKQYWDLLALQLSYRF